MRTRKTAASNRLFLRITRNALTDPPMLLLKEQGRVLRIFRSIPNAVLTFLAATTVVEGGAACLRVFMNLGASEELLLKVVVQSV